MNGKAIAELRPIRRQQQRGKTRGLLQKIRNIKGALHPKMGTIKDRNGKDLREAEKIDEMERIHRTVQKRS